VAGVPAALADQEGRGPRPAAVAPTCRPKGSRWPAWSAPPSDPLPGWSPAPRHGRSRRRWRWGLLLTTPWSCRRVTSPAKSSTTSSGAGHNRTAHTPSCLAAAAGYPRLPRPTASPGPGWWRPCRRVRAALVVCHGGGIEPGLVACLPDADHRLWGAPFGHCDGARPDFEDDRFVSVQLRRAPPRAELTP
jgi:hypothetical protein